MKPASAVCVFLLSIISIAHVLRLIYRTEIVIGATPLPMGVSVLAALISAALAGWLWREQRR